MSAHPQLIVSYDPACNLRQTLRCTLRREHTHRLRPMCIRAMKNQIVVNMGQGSTNQQGVCKYWWPLNLNQWFCLQPLHHLGINRGFLQHTVSQLMFYTCLLGFSHSSQVFLCTIHTRKRPKVVGCMDNTSTSCECSLFLTSICTITRTSSIQVVTLDKSHSPSLGRRTGKRIMFGVCQASQGVPVPTGECIGGRCYHVL